jgi:hypothetical protein
MEILIIVLITTVVFGLCFRFAPQVDKAKKEKEMREHMRDHGERVREVLEAGHPGDQAGSQPTAGGEAGKPGPNRG